MTKTAKHDKKRKKQQQQEEDDQVLLAKEDKKRTKKKQKQQEDNKPRAKQDKKKKHTGEENGHEPDGNAPEITDSPEKKRKKSSVITDVRFASAQSDPRFQRMPKHQSKVPIDSRFSRLFTDKSFSSSSAQVDKRGKAKKGKSVNPLLHYYLHQEEPEPKENGTEVLREGRSSESESAEEDFAAEESGADASSSDEDDDDDDDEYSVNSDIARYLMANHEDTPLTENETQRLAAVNMDWDHIKAVDLYVVMSSCLPKGGQLLSVAVYPSEFGLNCMEVEALHGPSGLFENNQEHSEDDDDEIVNEKLRSYELNKLRYYYAVVVCDSSATANHLYKTLDGTELLKTSNVLDLRFIPDSMEFKHPPRDIATEAPSSYKEPDFHTRALQHSRVKLSWEEDEPRRTKILRRKFNPNQLDELEEYLASSDGESDNDEINDAAALPDAEAQKHSERQKLLALLQPEDGSDADNSDDKDMEITFNTGLEDLSKRILEKKDKKSETVWEAILRKRSEKKARKKRSKYSSDDDSIDSDVRQAPDQPDDFFVEEPLDKNTEVSKKSSRKDLSKAGGKNSRKERKQSPEIDKEQEASKAELELLFANDQGPDYVPKGYNMKPKKVKGKEEKDVPTEDKLPNVDYSDDPRFSALFTSHLFALDPTDPQFKRTASYARKQSRKQRKGAGEETTEEEAINPSERVRLLSNDMLPEEVENLRLTGISSEKERHEFSSTVRSLKRNLGTLKEHKSR